MRRTAPSCGVGREISRFTIEYDRVTLEHIAREGAEFEWHDGLGDGWSHRVSVEWVGEPEHDRVPSTSTVRGRARRKTVAAHTATPTS